jgi:hypothetical protein
MRKIVDALAVEIIEQELTEERFLRKTNHANNEVYIFTAHNSPSLMHEVGRLRELTFRGAGGGTGNEIDLDNYDSSPDAPHQQLIVWDPDNKQIVGGYRYFIHDESKRKTDPGDMASHSYFTFSDAFRKDFLPYLMELGRSFVQPDYQSRDMGMKSLFALDNLWDGLVSLIFDNPNVRYLFGKVTMYPHFHERARNLVIHFMKKHFTDLDGLVIPKDDVSLSIDRSEMDIILTGSNYKDDYRLLSHEVRKVGENIPPLINAYMNLSPTMRSFGTVFNKDFGRVEETGIMITVKDIYVEKINRHLASYRENQGNGES